MFSVLTISAAVAFFSSPAAGAVGIDMISNGRYWWGGTWQHRPAYGDTNDCFCVKGIEKRTGVLTGYCYDGLDFNDHIEEQFIAGTFDHNQPIDITIHGSDALWADRFTVVWNGGQRWYGSQNTHGWCLSTDRNDDFDKYATHEGCHQTLSLNPNGNVYGYNGRGGHHNAGWLLDRMQRTCQGINGRRRVGSMPQDAATDSAVAEGEEADMMTPRVPITAEAAEGSEDVASPLTAEDEDPAGPNPNQVHNMIEGKVVSGLRNAIKKLVTENTDVTDEQIDSLLNSAMLVIEQLVEQEAGDEEVLDGSTEEQTGSTPLSRRLGA